MAWDGWLTKGDVVLPAPGWAMIVPFASVHGQGGVNVIMLSTEHDGGRPSPTIGSAAGVWAAAAAVVVVFMAYEWSRQEGGW